MNSPGGKLENIFCLYNSIWEKWKSVLYRLYQVLMNGLKIIIGGIPQAQLNTDPSSWKRLSILQIKRRRRKLKNISKQVPGGHFWKSIYNTSLRFFGVKVSGAKKSRYKAGRSRPFTVKATWILNLSICIGHFFYPLPIIICHPFGVYPPIFIFITIIPSLRDSLSSLISLRIFVHSWWDLCPSFLSFAYK